MEQGGPEYGPPSHNVDPITSATADSSSNVSTHAAAAVVPAPFLLKTYEMVDDANTETVVSWSPSGTSFVVWDPQHFCQHLLPRYFKHSNFSSFIRQLNIYGFRKSDPDRWEFANRGFARGQRQLLQGIRRRTSTVAGSRQGGMSLLSSREQEASRAHASVGPQCDAVAQCTTQMQNQLVLVSYGPGSAVLPMDTHSTRRGQSKQSVQEEIERLKRERSVLMMEVMRLRQQLQSMEHDLQAMWQHLQATEQRQHQMLTFVTRAANMNSQAFLANIISQQPHQICGQSLQQQIPWQPLNVSSASSAQQARAIGRSSEIGRSSQLALPIVGSGSESERSTGFLAGEVSFAKLSPQEDTIRPQQEDCDLDIKVSGANNPGLCPYLHGSQDHPQLSQRSQFSTFDGHHPAHHEAELSHFNRPQPRCLPASIRSESSATPTSSWLQDNCPQVPKPVLAQGEDQAVSDTRHYARQDQDSLTREHEYSNRIITREVSIGAAFLQKKHAEGRGSAEDGNMGGDVSTVGASNVDQPAEAYGYPDMPPGHSLDWETASKIIRRQHQSAFSLVGSAQNEQAQFGALFGPTGIGAGASTSRAPHLAGLPTSMSKQLLSSESHEQLGESDGQGLDRLNLMMSNSELGLIPAMLMRSSGVPDIHALENDTVFWDQLVNSAHNLQQPGDLEACGTPAPVASCTSSFQRTQPSDVAMGSSSQDDCNPPHQEWQWSGNPTLSLQSEPPARSWPDL